MIFFLGGIMECDCSDSPDTGNSSSSKEMIIPSVTNLVSNFGRLILYNFSIDKNTVIGEGKIVLTAEVTNEGDAPATDVIVSFYHSVDDAISIDDEKVGVMSIDSLESGESIETTLTITISEDMRTGDHYYGACIISTNATDEKTNTNNHCSMGEKVSVLERIDPDLSISIMRNDHKGSFLIPQQSFTMLATVKKFRNEQ